MCPDGFLPVYSVGTKQEADLLLAALARDLDGKHFARELFDENGFILEGTDRINGFIAFGKRLEFIHKIISENLTNGKKA